MGILFPVQKTVDELTRPFLKNEYGVNILNIGFGLGIVSSSCARNIIELMLHVSSKIDGMFQNSQLQIKNHVIIEPHPDVLRHMREKGRCELAE